MKERKGMLLLMPNTMALRPHLFIQHCHDLFRGSLHVSWSSNRSTVTTQHLLGFPLLLQNVYWSDHRESFCENAKSMPRARLPSVSRAIWLAFRFCERGEKKQPFHPQTLFCHLKTQQCSVCSDPTKSSQKNSLLGCYLHPLPQGTNTAFRTRLGRNVFFIPSVTQSVSQSHYCHSVPCMHADAHASTPPSITKWQLHMFQTVQVVRFRITTFVT